MTSFAGELERATEGLAALCRRSFGPCGEETLLFRPPDAPIVTGEGHAVLAAWKRGLDSDDPLTMFLLTAPMECTNNWEMHLTMQPSQEFRDMSRHREVCVLYVLTFVVSWIKQRRARNDYRRELFTAHDAAHLFISKFVRRLRETLHVQLIVSVEALDDSVIAACTRQDIACVQLAEPEDVEALRISAGIFPLASVFDDIRATDHIGVCTNGVSRVRFQQQACLRLRGLSGPSDQRKRKLSSEHRLEEIVVPQLLIHAPTKGVYKQYYAAIVKSLRVLRSWWEPVDHSVSIAYSCRGGGATELAIARWLQDGSVTISSDVRPRDPVMFSLVREIFANALVEVVSVLRNNLTSEAQGPTEPAKFTGYTLDYSRVIETLAGPILIPELVVGDPADFGLVHPWRRIDTLLFLALQTLEQLLRIDKVFQRHLQTK
ncbi:Chaperonin Cpn60/TCP-1 family [Phytophthora cactorum]|nr:Chaperonin Cpn60/TCP-1 family [Phytophthora cactorum]